jgi:hypothetical protein
MLGSVDRLGDMISDARRERDSVADHVRSAA